MIQALNDAAFHCTPDALWRTSAAWAHADSEHSEWLADMTAELLDIRALPEAPHPYEIVRRTDDYAF